LSISCPQLNAKRHEAIHQPRSRQPAHGMAKKLNDVCYPAGSARVRTRNCGQLIDKCLALALRAQTSPAAQPKLHGHDQPLDWQILKVPPMPTVPAR